MASRSLCTNKLAFLKVPGLKKLLTDRHVCAQDELILEPTPNLSIEPFVLSKILDYLTYIDPSVQSLAATNWRELLGMVCTCIELEAVSVLQHLAFLLEADPAALDIPGSKLWNQLRSTYSQITSANYVISIPHNSAFTASILSHTWHYYTTSTKSIMYVCRLWNVD